jgi:hypothetical protein
MVAAQKTAEARKPLSPQTMAALKQVAEVNRQPVEKPDVAPPVEDSKTEKEAAPQEPPAQAFEAPPTREDDLGLFGKNPFDDPKRRAEIEKRCDDLSFDSMILNGEVRQRVPIRLKTMEVEFRSHTAGEERYIKRLLYQLANEGTSPAHFQATLAIYNVALDIVSINGNPLTNHLNTDGTINEDGFKKKVAALERMPAVVVGDLATNDAWFNERLQKLVTEDNIKNG